jgi:hypothetical protein
LPRLTGATTLSVLVTAAGPAAATATTTSGAVLVARPPGAASSALASVRFSTATRAATISGQPKEKEQGTEMAEKPETRAEMLAYIREWGFTKAVQRFGHATVWQLTHPGK